MPNKIYTSNLEDWRLFEAAYKGGRQWREMNLLYQYLNEHVNELAKRTRQTPLENHAEGVISTYSGFIWREPPKRNFGRLENNVPLNIINKNADREGSTLNEFMKQILIWGSVFGTVWIIVDKPEAQVNTKAQEIQKGVHPYLKFYSPLDVTDYEFTPQENGEYLLTWLEVNESYTHRGEEVKITRKWSPSKIITEKTISGNTEITEKENKLGIVPAICHYNKKSITRGYAISDLQDIAGMQISIYNDLSELAQMVRGSNHKTLVKNKGDDATTGAGGVIIMDPDADPQRKPYLLSADASGLVGLLNTIDKKVEMINRMAHLTPVRTYRKQIISAVAMETEFQILNTLLAEKAAQLQQTEYQIFKMFCEWEGIDSTKQDFEVVYPQTFELRDRKADLEFIKAAKEIASLIKSVTLQMELNKQFARIALSDDDLIEKVDRELKKIKLEIPSTSAAPAA